MLFLRICLAFGFAVFIEGLDHSAYNCIIENNVKRDVIVQLHEWPWSSIASECENFLGPKGFCAVQVSPPHEHRVYEDNRATQRYEVVSYKLNKTRAGTEAQFRDMLTRCYNVGVRVYVDAVINHMTFGGSGTGSAGSSYDGDTQTYPAVPYYPAQFNGAPRCPTASLNIESMSELNQVKNCRRQGLRDLNQALEENRFLIRDYLNHLIDMGVAGFRVDSAKFMWTADLLQIYDSLSILRSDWFAAGERPYIYQDVYERENEPVKASEYAPMGRVAEHRFGDYLGQILRGWNGRALKDLVNFGNTSVWNMLDSSRSVSFVDNHDNQRKGPSASSPVVDFRESSLYTIASIFTLAWDYGYPRVMSSYNFTSDAAGPPAGSNGDTLEVRINTDGSCGNGWVCEHRWSPIANMVKFHNLVQGLEVTDWWDNRANQIAFGRGEVGYVAINMDDYDLSAYLETRLLPGIYCDVISGEKTMNNTCTGQEVIVDLTLMVRILIPTGGSGVPAIAIHRDSKLDE